MAEGEIRLSTAGARVLYAVEETKGTRPTTGYKDIVEVTETPDINPTPELLDATPLSATKYRIKIPGLTDLGESFGFTCNFSQTQLTAWNTTLVGEYESGIKEGKATWFCIYIPGFTDAFYFTGQPLKIGAPAMSVGSVLQTTLPVVPSNEPDWYTAPTDIAKVMSFTDVRVMARPTSLSGAVATEKTSTKASKSTDTNVDDVTV